MRSFIALCLLCCLLLFSCQKEADFSNNNNNNNGNAGGGSTSGTLLVKTVTKEGSDSAITVYTYNSGKKIIDEKSVGIIGGIDMGNEFRYYRNSSGIITSYTQINALFAMSGLDSVTTTVHYSTSSSKYTSTVQEISLYGFSVMDSSVFVYDGSGKIIRSDIYQSIPLTGIDYELTEKIKYTYANGNISQYDFYDATGGTDDLIATRKSTYDTKTNPLQLNNEAFAIGRPDFISANNGTKVEFIDVNDPTSNQTITFTYTYNSNNRPITATSTQNPGAGIRTYKFYYQ